MKIRIFYDGIGYRLRESRGKLSFIGKVIRAYSKDPVNLSFVFTNDETLIGINREFLKHNYNTDVIAFNYGNSKEIDGEIYISIDTVKRNSINYKVSLENEIIRVMIHGTLHLCGFNDRNEEERNSMRKEEDLWLLKLESK